MLPLDLTLHCTTITSFRAAWELEASLASIVLLLFHLSSAASAWSLFGQLHVMLFCGVFCASFLSAKVPGLDHICVESSSASYWTVSHEGYFVTFDQKCLKRLVLAKITQCRKL